jgi:hypothetical protein
MGSRRTRVLLGALAAVAAVAALAVFGLASAHAPAGG